MPNIDIDAFADKMLAAVRGHVAQVRAELERRIDELPEARAGRDGKDAELPDIPALVKAAAAALPRARDGRDADMNALGALLDRLVEERLAAAVAALPKAKDGKDGQPGESVDLESVRELLQEDLSQKMLYAIVEAVLPNRLDDIRTELIELVGSKVAYAASCIAIPHNGKDGKDAVLPDIGEMVRAAVDALPKAVDGKDGADGRSVAPEEVRALVEAAVAALPKPQDGRDGVDGKTVALEDVRGMINELLARALEAMPKPKDGVDGADGAPGADAVLPDIDALIAAAVSKFPRPRDGRDADMSAVGALIDRLVEERVTAIAAGIELPTPKDGAPGRDAAELEILPSIDETRSYRRGTWASHRGGLMRAARETDAVGNGDLAAAGWIVMVEGVASLAIEQGEDPRELRVHSTLTSGLFAVAKLRLPVLVYRGIWREGDYQEGDVATWGGSAWHCQQPTSDKPGSSPAWKLMVKEGKHGRDAPGATTKAERPVVRLK